MAGAGSFQIVVRMDSGVFDSVGTYALIGHIRVRHSMARMYNVRYRTVGTAETHHHYYHNLRHVYSRVAEGRKCGSQIWGCSITRWPGS
jgi:hypothetical protein